VYNPEKEKKMDWDRNDYNTEGSTKITKTCNICGEKIVVWVEDEDYKDWVNGKLCQDAFPYLDAGQREILISNTCGRCFDLLFEADCV
jgi:hypothetical protein